MQQLSHAVTTKSLDINHERWPRGLNQAYFACAYIIVGAAILRVKIAKS